MLLTLALSVPMAVSAASASSRCVAIKSTSACAPWTNGLAIDAASVASQYGLDPDSLSADQWERALVKTSASDSPFFSEALNCPGLGSLQFMRSYLCLRDIWVLSDDCSNPPPSPALCSDTCEAFGDAVSIALADLSLCPTKSGAQAHPGWEKLRSMALDAGTKCKALTNSWGGDMEDDSCRESVSEDFNTCGFAGNLPATQAYCSSFSKIQKPSCCNTLPPSKPNFNLMSSLRSSGNEMLKRLNAIVPLMDKPIQQKNDLNNTPASGNQTSPPAPSQGLSTGAIAGIAVGCIALVGAVASIFVVRKRHEIFDVDHPINKALGSRGRPSVKRGASVYKRDRGELSQYRHHLQGEYAPLKATAAPGATASPDVDVIPASSGFSLGGGDRKVILEYTANLPDELSLKVGETVTIVELFDDGWIRGLQQRTNRTGLFPSQCVGLDPPQTV